MTQKELSAHFVCPMGMETVGIAIYGHSLLWSAT